MDIGQVVADVKSGECFHKFGRMPTNKRIEIALLAAAVTAVVGVIFGLLSLVIGPILGSIAGFVTFAYLTSSYQEENIIIQNAKSYIQRVRETLSSWLTWNTNA